MTDLEAINILSELKDGIKPKESVAILKGIQALTEKIEREAKKQEIKARHKHKCRECEHFSFGYGGLCETLGHCAIKDSPFTDMRQASCRACKDFIQDRGGLNNE